MPVRHGVYYIPNIIGAILAGVGIAILWILFVVIQFLFITYPEQIQVGHA